MATALQFLQLDAVGGQPLTVGMLVCQLLLDLTIVVDLTLLGVDQQNLSRLQTTLLGNLRRVEVHHAHLGCHHHRIVLGDGVTSRTKSVAVEHTTGKTTVREQEGGRTVPWLHQDGMVLVESFQILTDRVLVVERLRYQHAHGMW